jgi:propanediol dehydratase small subunit
VIDPILNKEPIKPNKSPCANKAPTEILFDKPLHEGEPGAVKRTANGVLDEVLDKAVLKPHHKEETHATLT